MALVAALVLLPGLASGTTSTGVLDQVRARTIQVFPLSAAQTDSVNQIAAAFQQFGDGDYRKLAYILATAWHESRLKPIKEIKGAEGSALWEIQKKYWYTGFFGRGFVQITWEDNYRKMGNLLGVDLVSNPDLALRSDIAAKIIVLGMLGGHFTGKRLDTYINSTQTDFYNARRTVGAIMVLGKDTAALIEGYTNQIL